MFCCRLLKGLKPRFPQKMSPRRNPKCLRRNHGGFHRLCGIDCFAYYRTVIVRKSRDPLPRPAPAPAAPDAAPAATSGKNRLAEEEEEEMCRLVLEYGRLSFSACWILISAGSLPMSRGRPARIKWCGQLCRFSRKSISG